jgi:hypothetical protein
VALFAGELSDGDTGRRLLDGEPFALAPPTLVGLPCRQVIWTVQVPADVSLRVAAPARIVADDAILAERRAALQRLEADFQQAIESSAGWQQDRVRTFLESRRDGAIPAADQAWARSLTGLSSRFPAPPPATILIVAGESADAEAAGRLTIRAVRQRDPTTRGRAIATLSLLTCGGLIWLAARRQWSSRLPTVTSPGPAIALVAGLAWIALLVPEWPGWLLAAGAAVALAMQAVRRRQLPTAAELPAAIDIAEATTIYRPQR